MQRTPEYSTSPPTSGCRNPVWLAILVAASVVFSHGFACATPFAAFASIAAFTLRRKDALYVLSGAWIINQLDGFIFLGYPWTAYSIHWGIGLGISAMLATWAAETVAHNVNAPPIPRICATLLAAFTAYELVIFFGSLILGGTENFTLHIQSRILVINVAALTGLFVLNFIGETIGLATAPTFSHKHT